MLAWVCTHTNTIRGNMGNDKAFMAETNMEKDEFSTSRVLQ